MSERQDVAQAEDTVESVQKLLTDLNAQFESESNALTARIDPTTEALDTVSIKPKKADIDVQLVALVWAPFWQDANGNLNQAW
jgi:hypothetical protein